MKGKSKESRFKCRGCEQWFISQPRRSEHHKVCELAKLYCKPYNKTGDGKFKCRTYGLVASKQSSIRRHVKAQHQTVKPVKTVKVFTCGTCSKTFATQ